MRPSTDPQTEADRIRRHWPDSVAAQQKAWRRISRALAEALAAVQYLDRTNNLWDTLDQEAKEALPTLKLLAGTARRLARKSARQSREFSVNLADVFARYNRGRRKG